MHDKWDELGLDYPRLSFVSFIKNIRLFFSRLNLILLWPHVNSSVHVYQCSNKAWTWFYSLARLKVRRVNSLLTRKKMWKRNKSGNNVCPKSVWLACSSRAFRASRYFVICAAVTTGLRGDFRELLKVGLDPFAFYAGADRRRSHGYGEPKSRGSRTRIYRGRSSRPAEGSWGKASPAEKIKSHVPRDRDVGTFES